MSAMFVRPSPPLLTFCCTPADPLATTARYWSAGRYLRAMPRDITYVYIDEHDVSVQLSDRSPRLTTWNQRPVAGSCHRAQPADRNVMMSMSCCRCGWLAGRYSSTSVVAMPNQPIARHHDSGAWPVVLSAQVAAGSLGSCAQAWRSSPVLLSRRCPK